VAKAWNIIDSGLVVGSTGHHYWETKALADELVARGKDVRIFSCQTPLSAQFPAALSARFPGALVYHIFSLVCYATVSDHPYKSFVKHNRVFYNDLLKIEQSLFDGSVTYFATISERQLLGTIRWLAQFQNSARPKTVVVLQAPESNASEKAFERLWANCPPQLKNDLVLTVRSPPAADQFHQLLGVRPYVLPSPLGVTEGRIQTIAKIGTPPPEPLVISFIGGARSERGIKHIPDVVKLCTPLGIRFFIHVKADGEHDPVRLLSRLSEHANVDVQLGMLKRDAYYDAIARSVILIPCDPIRYRRKISGVYLEAKCLGAPVIVPAGSWMADEVKLLGNGLVFEEYTATAMAACIARAQREIGKLRERAAARAREFSAINGPDRCVEAIESYLQAN
jgi:glycosyltransferase involved in cell wall biosynthesis